MKRLTTCICTEKGVIQSSHRLSSAGGQVALSDAEEGLNQVTVTES